MTDVPDRQAPREQLPGDQMVAMTAARILFATQYRYSRFCDTGDELSERRLEPQSPGDLIVVDQIQVLAASARYLAVPIAGRVHWPAAEVVTAILVPDDLGRESRREGLSAELRVVSAVRRRTDVDNHLDTESAKARDQVGSSRSPVTDRPDDRVIRHWS